MEDIINVGLFIQHLLYYLKSCIYINKGTTDDTILERCIVLHNKLIKIGGSEGISEDDETFIRKCLKRLNLVLKIDAEGNPVDIRKKENQLKMIILQPHPSLTIDDSSSMLEYATKHKINILTGIPLTFILKTDSQHFQILWQYTRSLFYISQVIISKNDGVEPNDSVKNKIFESGTEKLEDILQIISNLEEKSQLGKSLALDSYLKHSLIEGFSKINLGKIDKGQIDSAKGDIKELFKKKGIKDDNFVLKMMDSVYDKLMGTDFSSGNIMETVFSISQNVHSEFEINPDQMQDVVSAVCEIFKEMSGENGTKDMKIPKEFADFIQTYLPTSDLGEKKAEFDELLQGDFDIQKLLSCATNNNFDMGDNGNNFDIQKLLTFGTNDINSVCSNDNSNNNYKNNNYGNNNYNSNQNNNDQNNNNQNNNNQNNNNQNNNNQNNNNQNNNNQNNNYNNNNYNKK